MRMRGTWLGLCLVVGCTGTAAINSADERPRDSETGGIKGDSHDAAAANDGGVDAALSEPEDAGTSDRDAESDASPPSSAEDAGGTPIDAGAAHDAGGVDANVQLDAGDPAMDAGSAVDAGPPPACAEGTGRCRAFRREVCTGGAWKWQVGDQTCCTEPGRYSTGAAARIVVDSRTGKAWLYGSGQSMARSVAESSCASQLPGGHLPTAVEMMELTIGLPDNNIAVCSPAIDHTAFPYAYPGVHFAQSPGECVDLNVGATVECPPDADGAAYLCVAH